MAFVWNYFPTKSEPTIQLSSPPFLQEPMLESPRLLHDAPSLGGNTSVEAAAIPDSVALIAHSGQSNVSPPVQSIDSNDTARLKHDSSMDKDLPKVPTAKPTMAANHNYGDPLVGGGKTNIFDIEVKHDQMPAFIQFLETKLERLRIECQGLSNENTELWKNQEIYAQQMASLEDRLRTESSKRMGNTDGQQMLIARLKQVNETCNRNNATLQQILRRERDESKLIVEDFQRNENKLHQECADLQRKLDKKSESYKDMAKKYMDQIRPIRVTDDDNSTLYYRLTQIRVSIEQLIQKARGDRSVNLNKDVALEYFKNSESFAGFANLGPELTPNHLDLCMEAAVMSTLVLHFFQRPLGCIYKHSEEFEDIYNWVFSRDSAIADRWRQQLCVMALQDSDIAARRQQEVNSAVEGLSEMVSRVYSNVDVSIKITELCNEAFDLSIAMFGFEYIISPIPTPLDTPFDEETMTMPRGSNPKGTVKLVIFPAFGNKSNAFNMKAKVWCH